MAQKYIDKNQQSIYEFDVFISYSSTDREWVEESLLKRLENAGIKVCIHFRDFEGSPIIENITWAICNSRKTLLVITPDYFESDWTTFERLIAQSLDPANIKRRLVILKRKPSDMPTSLSFLTHLDFVEPADENWQKLFRLIKKGHGQRERMLSTFPTDGITKNNNQKNSKVFLESLRRILEYPFKNYSIPIAGTILVISTFVYWIHKRILSLPLPPFEVTSLYTWRGQVNATFCPMTNVEVDILNIKIESVGDNLHPLSYVHVFPETVELDKERGCESTGPEVPLEEVKNNFRFAIANSLLEQSGMGREALWEQLLSNAVSFNDLSDLNSQCILSVVTNENGVATIQRISEQSNFELESFEAAATIEYFEHRPRYEKDEIEVPLRGILLVHNNYDAEKNECHLNSIDFTDDDRI